MSPSEKKLFHFKQFSVRHDRSGMKVGTDGVLLGAWTDIRGCSNVLDIGAGTGVIALMLAQRTPSNVLIESVEIDGEAHADAQENFRVSPWKDRLSLHHSEIQNFTAPHKFDLMISNPPYFQNSFEPPDAKRKTARHTHLLPFKDLLNAANKLLGPDGRLSLILPQIEGLEFIALAKTLGYYCSRKWDFRSRAHKPIERLLLEFTRKDTGLDEGSLLLYHNKDEWSDDYKNLTKDFYLKL